MREIWKMKLSSVRPKGPSRSTPLSAHDQAPTTPLPTTEAESASPIGTRRRSSIFRGLRRYSSKQKLAHVQIAPCRSTSGASSQDSPTRRQTSSASDDDLPPLENDLPSPSRFPPTLLLQKASPERTPPLDRPSTPHEPAGIPTLAPSPSAPRPQLPRSPLRYSRTPSPTKNHREIADRRGRPLVQSGNSYFPVLDDPPALPTTMARRRIWVRRPGATPTQVHINDEDLVDDVKDMILRKYGNSLGRSFDSPDVTIRLTPRERSMPERALGPDELMVKTLEAYFPGGQAVEEALLIDVPAKRTPKASPRLASHTSHYIEDHRPVENGTEYFPPMPIPSPGHASSGHDSRLSYHAAPHAHSISVLETGQVPALPSPGARKVLHRPRIGRTLTSSPTTLGTAGQSSGYAGRSGARVRRDSDLTRSTHAPAPPPPPTPPMLELASNNGMLAKAATPPIIDRVSSPRPAKAKKARKQLNGGSTAQQGSEMRNSYASLPPGVLDNSVPPINVLIVEDNIINLKLLEQLARKLKIRWSTAMNGRDAVDKWRTGGFHLVLMDIQLPIMNGLEATKEIRRLERLNGIAVFARSTADESAGNGERGGALDEESSKPAAAEADKLNPDEMIKSPVIIVALTASSLQSDRHEALAAGCNDFLTKPVNTVWFERKVMEWGCMQALIDFEGWRKWKDLSKEQERDEELEKQRKKEARQENKRTAMLAKLNRV